MNEVSVSSRSSWSYEREDKASGPIEKMGGWKDEEEGLGSSVLLAALFSEVRIRIPFNSEDGQWTLEGSG